MKVRFWGTRGSVPTPGAEASAYGGNTSCVEVRATPGAIAVLDAGTGIQQLGPTIGEDVSRVDVLLTHLHMDHILGLGFFAALHRPELEVHLWGPASTTLGLRGRLTRYLSPPLFPVRIRDLECELHLDEVPRGTFEIPGLRVDSDLVCHPGPTAGFRLDDGTNVVTYLPDHEPALGARRFPDAPRWTSGYDLAEGATVLIHDAQYTDEEYARKVGWGHSSISQAIAYARHVGARTLVASHHDPTHSDAVLDELYVSAPDGVIAAREGLELDLAAPAA